MEIILSVIVQLGYGSRWLGNKVVVPINKLVGTTFLDKDSFLSTTIGFIIYIVLVVLFIYSAILISKVR